MTGPMLRRVFVALVATLAAASPASACPVCDRATGRQVRAGIFDGHFTANLAAAASPFGIIFGLAAAIHHLGQPPRAREPDDA